MLGHHNIHDCKTKVWERSILVRKTILQVTSTCEPRLTISSQHIKSFLGSYDERVVFLDHRLWMRSVNLSKMARAEAAAPSAAPALETLAERHLHPAGPCGRE